MNLGLKDLTVLVTGAGQGLGKDLAMSFASEGARVAFHYLSSGDGAMEAAEAARREYGVEAVAFRADISRAECVDQLLASIHERLGKVAVVVNNAAYTGTPKNFIDTHPDEWQEQYDVTVKGMMLVTRAVLHDMIAEGQGSIVTMAGESGRVGESQAAVTSATRAAALGFTKALAKEVARYKIRANAVTLGLIDTPTTQRDVVDRVSPEILDRIKKAYPIRRFGTAGDVAPAVLLLASPLSAWTTGQTYAVNGGYTML